MAQAVPQAAHRPAHGPSLLHSKDRIRVRAAAISPVRRPVLSAHSRGVPASEPVTALTGRDRPAQARPMGRDRQAVHPARLAGRDRPVGSAAVRLAGSVPQAAALAAEIAAVRAAVATTTTTTTTVADALAATRAITSPAHRARPSRRSRLCAAPRQMSTLTAR